MGHWYLLGFALVAAFFGVREFREWQRLKKSREPLERNVRELKRLAKEAQAEKVLDP